MEPVPLDTVASIQGSYTTPSPAAKRMLRWAVDGRTRTPRPAPRGLTTLSSSALGGTLLIRHRTRDGMELVAWSRCQEGEDLSLDTCLKTTTPVLTIGSVVAAGNCAGRSL